MPPDNDESMNEQYVLDGFIAGRSIKQLAEGYDLSEKEVRTILLNAAKRMIAIADEYPDDLPPSAKDHAKTEALKEYMDRFLGRLAQESISFDNDPEEGERAKSQIDRNLSEQKEFLLLFVGGLIVAAVVMFALAM